MNYKVVNLDKQHVLLGGGWLPVLICSEGKVMLSTGGLF
jgi:hypothetical protein